MYNNIPLFVQHDALPRTSVQTLVDMVYTTPRPKFEVYSNQFECKLSLPKTMHTYPVIKHVLDQLRSQLMLSLLGRQYFGIAMMKSDQLLDDYFTALFMYREGEFLQRHYDCAVHNGMRKVVTVLLYMTECEGGELNVAGQIVKPQFNTLVAFANTDESWHEVTPVQTGERIVLTTGYTVPVNRVIDRMTRTNTRAIFIPGDDEVWDDATERLAQERSQ